MDCNIIDDWLDEYGDKDIERKVSLDLLLKERDYLLKNCTNEDLLDGSFIIKLNELNIAIGQLEDLK